MSDEHAMGQHRFGGTRATNGARSVAPRARGLRSVPRLTIGLPVYNGERILGEALDALLGQTYEDFELIVSDNASTDGTADICRRYAEQDSRIRYVRQPRNIGLVPNHIYLMEQARGELFKWASYDDLYARDLLTRCVEALDDDPDVVLAHSWSAMIDGSGNVTGTFEHRVVVDSPRAPERFRSMLFDGWDDHAYGVIRTRVLRQMTRRGSYHFADRTLNTELALYGRFHLVPDWLYFRREHPGRPPVTVRERCAGLDPRRADRLRHPVVRLYGEYLWGYVSAIRQAPLSTADRRECYWHLAHWIASRALPVAGRAVRREPLRELPLSGASGISVESVVAGRETEPA
jgi:glycosyltransferase involved in cell wall biosynthesis